MENSTENQTLGRNWYWFIRGPQPREILESEIENAAKINHSTVINGRRVDCIYLSNQFDFKAGVDLAKLTLQEFFSKLWHHRDSFLKDEDLTKRFQDIGTGWRFSLNEEDYMEVHLVQ